MPRRPVGTPERRSILFFFFSKSSLIFLKSIPANLVEQLNSFSAWKSSVCVCSHTALEHACGMVACSQSIGDYFNDIFFFSWKGVSHFSIVSKDGIASKLQCRGYQIFVSHSTLLMLLPAAQEPPGWEHHKVEYNDF